MDDPSTIDAPDTASASGTAAESSPFASSADSPGHDAAGGQFASTEAGWNVPGVTKSSQFAANGAPHIEPIPADVAALVAGLAGVCRGLLDVDRDAAPGCLPELVEQLVVQQNCLAAVVAHFLAGLSKHGDADTVGRLSTGAWLQSRTRMPQGEATRMAKVASGVFGEDSVLPRTRAAFSDGRITAAHAEEMARGVDKFAPEDRDRLKIEELLLNVALASTSTKVKSVAQDMADRLKPDKHEDKEQTDYDSRSLAAVSTFGNTVDIRGIAAGLEGEEILDFFHRITIAPQGPDDTRNKGQRCFDGFLDFIRSHQDTQPTMGGFRPGIIVTAEFSEVIRLLGHHTGQQVPDAPTIDDLRRIVAAHLGVHPDDILYNEDNDGQAQDTEDDNDLGGADVADFEQFDEDQIGGSKPPASEMYSNLDSNSELTEIDADNDAADHTGADSETDEADIVSGGSEELFDNIKSSDRSDSNAANRISDESDVDKVDPRRTIPRQRPTPQSSPAPPNPPGSSGSPGLAQSRPDSPPRRTGPPPSPPGHPSTPPHQPNTGVGSSFGLPTKGAATPSTPSAAPSGDQTAGSTLPTTWMPTWRDFVEAAQRITDPKIRHLLNGAAATAAWAEAPHVSTRAPGTRTLNGHPVSVGTLRRLMCDAKVMPAIFDGRGQILDFGAAKRTFSVAQRRALVLRDKHCRWRGCTMPYQFCEAHHVVPVEFHGPTNIDDGILLCCNHRVSRMRLGGSDVEARTV